MPFLLLESNNMISDRTDNIVTGEELVAEGGCAAQSENMDVIVEKLFKKIRPMLETIRNDNACGFINGMANIRKYIGPRRRSYRYNDSMPTHQTIIYWWRNYGFPMNKDAKNQWWTTKSLLDSWMRDRETFMRKADDMGIKRASWHGWVGMLPPELTEIEDRNRVFAAIREDYVKKGLGVD